MNFFNTRLIYSTLFYVLLLILVVISKPSLIFEDDGEIKRFGVGDEKTMFSFGVATIVLAIVSFYVFCLIDIVFRKF